MSYFRKNIELMSGYTPGEQPKIDSLIKLNTNENPYPPSPNVINALKHFDYANLRLYPNPMSDALRDEIALAFALERDNIITGNGSDDILTITVRAFLNENEKAACFFPTYSLYPVLSQIQNCEIIQIPLENTNFSFPEELLNIESKLFKSIEKCKVFFIARPNAPTGTDINLKLLDTFCSLFKGIILIDEAYADFADETAISLLKLHKNVIISKTMSKSYSLAGIRLGWAMADKEIITGMVKVKDSYNVNMLTQRLAIEAIKDKAYFNSNIKKIIKTRNYLSKELNLLGYRVLPSQANFVYVKIPNNKASELFSFLRENKIIVRHFPGKITGNYLRITIGTEEQINILLDVIRKFKK